MTKNQTWPEKFDIHKLVTIPEDIEKLIKGEKTSVRRNDRYADPGDTTKLDGHTFIIENVYPQKLKDVTEEDAKDEGYQSLEAYKQAITSIHEAVVWDPEMEVWVHELKRQ
ncbi:ASCH domain-containing protein [Lentibacillus sp. L22]|uniref:ASCH domain-containing protein n=1 Tax=Lentibacillus TaxID=175304 RepID=UPI0022B1A34C|nr:ASCH domain-containing protein [Lentibacillus daqui]